MTGRKKFALPKNLGYADALSRLQTIVEELQNGETDIDLLGDKVEEAAALVQFCRDKLQGTQARVDRILNKEND